MTAGQATSPSSHSPGVLDRGDSVKLAPPDHEAVCLEKCFIKYIKNVTKCIRQYPPGPELDECFNEALEKLVECLKNCHDQGKSD